MATIQTFAVNDSSTYANYFAWASAISAAFATFTWKQSTDTGQVMWSGMNLSQVAMSGSNATYTYSALTGLALAVGRALTITGMTNGANNGVFIITATGAGTFTVVNGSGVNESGSTGAVTAAAAAPGSGAFFYEVWTPADGLTNFYLKMEYGNLSGTNSPTVRITLSSAMSGAGVATGFIIGPGSVANLSYTPPSSVATYECDFSGAAGRFGAMMWRNSPAANAPQLFAIERSVNSSGTYTGSYVTIWTLGSEGASRGLLQKSLLFGVGVGPGIVAGTNGALWSVRQNNGALASVDLTFNGSIPFDTCAPVIGYYDYPCTVCGAIYGPDVAEGVAFQATVYGGVRTYMASKVAAFGQGSLVNMAVCLRYD